MSDIKKKQYNFLNILKLVAAFFVVAIHVHFPGDFGKAVIVLARFAVPFFFMVSGFFSYYENGNNLNQKYKRKIKHICILFAGCSALYFAFGCVVSLFGNGIVSYVKNIFSFKSIIEFLLFNNTSISEFMWFLPALIYTYVVFFVFEKKGITKRLYFLIPVLFLSGILLREIPEIFDNAPAIFSSGFVYRNFIFIGLPFFMLGHFIRYREDYLKEKLSNPFLVIMMLIGNVLALLADFMHISKSVYFGTFIAVFALFVFAVKNENKFNIPLLADAGARYSLYIYMFHIMIKNVVNRSGSMFEFIGKILSFIEPVMPVVIFIFAVIASAVYVFAKNTVKDIIRKKQQING